MLSVVWLCGFFHPTVCSLINISTGVYTLCSFKWRSAGGKAHRVSPEEHPWLHTCCTCLLLHGPEANSRGQDICVGNSWDGWDNGVAAPSENVEGEERMGRQLFFWDPGKITSTKGGKWRKYVNAHLAPNLLHYLWSVFFLLGSRDVSDCWLL